MSKAGDPSERLVDLESMVTHLQREVEQLNEVLVEQSKLLQGLQKSLSELESRMDAVPGEPESFDPRLERPPHY